MVSSVARFEPCCCGPGCHAFSACVATVASSWVGDGFGYTSTGWGGLWRYGMVVKGFKRLKLGLLLLGVRLDGWKCCLKSKRQFKNSKGRHLFLGWLYLQSHILFQLWKVVSILVLTLSQPTNDHPSRWQVGWPPLLPMASRLEMAIVGEVSKLIFPCSLGGFRSMNPWCRPTKARHRSTSPWCLGRRVTPVLKGWKWNSLVVKCRIWGIWGI